jgi:excisionase family DNA binding protein
MNLADAIRRAAQTSGAPLGQLEGFAERVPSTDSASLDAGKAHREVRAPAGNPSAHLAKEHDVKSLEDQANHPGGNIVRLELVLNPEQLKGFFGAVIASQHSVLTLREAASYLRVSPASLEKHAESGEVPGLSVDGKWRFTRTALEEWLNSHPKRKEA